MPSLCPACGSQISPLTLAFSLQNRVAARQGRIVKLSPQQAAMLHTLITHQPLAVTEERFAVALWGIGTEAPEDERRHIGVLMHKLRRVLAPLGVRVKNKYGVGYRLVLDEMPVACEVAA